MEEMGFDIKDIFKILKNRWKVIVAITATITLIVGIISIFVMKPIYRGNTKVFVGKDITDNVKYDNSDIEMYQKLLKTYAELVKTSDLIENAIDEKKLDITVSEINSSLVATPRIDTQILEISYENSDSELAKEVLVAVVDEFIKETKILIPNGKVKVIESVQLPKYPVSPNNSKNIELGFLGGLVLGIIVSLLIEYMDNTFKTKEQVEKEMNISVIGVIPCEDKKRIRTKDKHIKKSKNKSLNDPAYDN